MVSFRPPFQLMLVSLNLVLLLALQSSSALADDLHPDHGAAHAGNAVRRHAARAGRLSKRFPPVSGSSDDNPSAAKRDRHRRDHHRFGLTPAEIADLLAEQQIEDSGLDEPSFHAFNATSTTSTSHHHSRTRTASDSQDPTSTGSMSGFALPTSNTTSPSHTTSSSSAAASATSSRLHASSSSSDDGDSSSASSPSTTADDGFQNTTSTHRHHSHTSSGATPAAPTSSSGSDNIGSTNSNGTATNENDNGEGLGGLLGGILGAPSASSSSVPHRTGASRSGSASSTSSSSGNGSDNGGLLGNLLGGSPTSSASAAHSTAGSQDDAPSATSSSSAASATSSSDDPDSDDDDTPPSSSKHSQSTQPDFYSFTPQATRSSSRSLSTPTASGLLQGLLPQLIPSSSSSSNAATATPFPTSSPSTSDGSDAGSDSGTTSTSDSTSSSTSDGSEGGSTTTASTATSQTTATVTTGPSSTSQNTGAVPTGTGSGGDAGSSGSGSDSSSVQPPSSSASRSTASSSSSDDSGSASSASSSSSATTNPYWYANTKSLNMAPSSTASADQPAETGSQSTGDSDTSSGTTSSASSGGVGTAPAAQDLPTTIVPSADSYDQPANTTSIGLLFKPDMKWTWVISQADLTAQIFAFMPDLVGQSAGLESSKVSTVKLAGYSTEANDTATPASLSTARTLYMAYVPSSSVEDIQAMIANTSSPFYTSAAEGAPQQLASQVDPTFNILSVAGQVAAGAKQNAKASSGTSKDDSTTRNSLIGVGCGLAGCFALVAGGMLYRKQRKNKEADGADGNAGGVSRAHTIRSFHGGLRETWAPEAMDQHRAFDAAGEMQQVWSPQGIGMAMGHPEQAAAYPHEDGFGGYVTSDPFHDAAGAGAAGAYVNMNRSSRMTERSAYSDLSQMTEAQRIQYDYESSRRSFQSTSDHSGSQGAHSEHSMHSGNSAGMLSTYQEDYRVPRQHTTNHAFGERSNNTRSRRRGSVASSTIGRPEMMSNSVLL
ncbi:hypothetical protein PHBOTO_000362 [Pseudozyma hubeiensis]|nr:hypothetical protein PHBOTO_000362 [Pseudozyma hubeiensis]